MSLLKKCWKGIRVWVVVVILVLLFAAASVTTFVLPVLRAKANQSGTAGNWPTYMADDQRSGFNGSEKIINPQSAPNLKVHWAFQGRNRIFSQPVVDNGMIYWGSWDGYEHATNLHGKAVWQQYVGQKAANCGPNKSFGVISTATVASIAINGTMTPLVFVGGGDDHLYALNASSGAIIWKTALGVPSSNTFIWDSPVVYKNSVYIGTASIGDCPLVQGQLFRLNAATGAIQSTFDVVPKNCVGAGIWGSPAIDANANSIYFTTGTQSQCSTQENNAIALVKLNATNLSFTGSWQIPLAERVHDSDFGTTPTLFQATIGGKLHLLVGAANKNGTYYAFDRSNIGNGPLWRAKIAVGGACPGCGNGSISSSAWDGKALYVAGGSTTINGINCRGSLRALDPASGHFIWEHCMNEGTVIGAVTVVPGLVAVVAGASLVLVDARSGKTLFTYNGLKGMTHLYGSPSIANGVLYIGSEAGKLYALGT